jgi:predicted Zn-dependent protease
VDAGVPRLRLTAGRWIVLAALAFVAACTSSPLGRSQLILYPEADVAAMGQAAFAEMQSQTPLLRQGRTNRYVQCVADQLLRSMPGTDPATWEVRVFDDPAVNAFALPGRKIGVYRGLLDVAVDQHQLAAVIGHEIAHVTARHANERISTQAVADSGLQIVQIAAGSSSPARSELFGLLGLGAQVGLLLPFNRAQESEADLVGQEVMANAGFDPRASVTLWRNMARATEASQAGARQPDFLSTHPSSAARINELEGRMPAAMARYDAARRSGRAPDCSR